MEKAKLQKELEKVTHLHEASLLEEQLKVSEANISHVCVYTYIRM